MDFTNRSRDQNMSVISSNQSLMHEHIFLDIKESSRRATQASMQAISPIGALTWLHRITLRVLDSRFASVFLSIWTVFALFGDEVRTCIFPKSYDDVFDSLICTAIGVFLLDMALTYWVRPDYRCSFYFVLDVLAVVSLVPDLEWFWNGVTGATGSQFQLVSVQSAVKASRAGVRTSKIIRFLRLIRIVRLVKLYKHTRPTIKRRLSQVHSKVPNPSQSNIGKKMNDLTTKRVIAVVLVLLVLLPLCDLAFFDNPPSSWDYGMQLLEQGFGNNEELDFLSLFLAYHQTDRRPLIFLSCETTDLLMFSSSATNPTDLRITELYYATSNNFLAIFDLRKDTILSAELAMLKMLFICAMFTFGAIYLTRDTNNLVILPIEKMMEKVKRLAENPLGSQDNVFEDESDFSSSHSSWHHKELEPTMVENTIMKIGALLALGFGEAGSHIIAESLAKTGGTFNPMQEGTKIKAIFGFCDVRNFTDTTEVLQEGIMAFINEIARILHYAVDAHLGAPNKNIGDAFLLVWKVPNDCGGVETAYVTNLADLALISFLKTLSYLSSSSVLLEYRGHPGLARNMPNYHVKMGFGLHFGWAIEGAMGSQMKIDVSYLSPHVNLTMQLEEASKLYGVPLVFSSVFFDLLSEPVQLQCRHIDTVQFKGSSAPMRIYTFDTASIFARLPTHKEFSKAKSKEKRRKLVEMMKEVDFHAYETLLTSHKLLRMRSFIDSTLKEVYREAITAYESGDWEGSRKALEDAMKMNPSDEPSKVIYGFISETDFNPPVNWRGFREIREF